MNSPHGATPSRLGSAALLSCLAIAIMFWGLFQIDLPFARFLRSLHALWLERAGDVGTRLGSGAMLVSLSVGLLLAGWALTQARAFEAGWRSLLAHGLAALVAQSMKHVIGRPRPRLMHADNGFPWRPSFESGLDSFPSGHTTASFAVATVMARFYPRLAWVAYGLATFVAFSRAIRGSHFPTDVMAGVCLGTVIGISAVHPIRDWKPSIVEGMTHRLPYLLLTFSLLWLVTHIPTRVTANLMMIAGGLCLILGTGLRIFGHLSDGHISDVSSRSMGDSANMLLIVGLALTTGLWLVVALAVLLCLIQWLTDMKECPQASFQDKPPHYRTRGQAIMAEISLLTGLALAVFSLHLLKGWIPVF